MTGVQTCALPICTVGTIPLINENYLKRTVRVSRSVKLIKSNKRDRLLAHKNKLSKVIKQRIVNYLNKIYNCIGV